MAEDSFLRQSQVVTSFGPGALVDLPEHSVIVGGLGTWKGHHLVPVHEKRLEAKLARLLDVGSVKLYAPPPFDDRDEQRRSFIGGFVFPTWFETQGTVAGGGGRHRRRRLVGWAGTENGRSYIDPQEPRKDAKKRLVPVRFVCGCKRGHIDDIDWRAYIHHGERDCTRALWIEERGTAGDVADVVVGCDCGRERRMYEALSPGPLGTCRGRRPWLGSVPWEGCSQPNKLLVRTGSNTYFPVRISVISLPDGDDKLAEAVARNWDVLGDARTEGDVQARRFDRVVKVELADYDDVAVLRAILSRMAGDLPETEVSVKAAEFDVLSSGVAGVDGPESLYFAEALTDRAAWGGEAPGLEGVLHVVAVHRLREVIAQVGFTRISPPATEVDGELDPDVERADLDIQQDWLPAFENRGEGLFIQLDPARVVDWLAWPAVQARARQLEAGFARWAAERQVERTFPGAAYIMVHTLAHLLLTAIAEECGYPASALRERVYALHPGQFGVLLYTATPGADGTLGGLAACAARAGALIQRAVALAELCSNDPICAHHAPDEAHGDRPLHGAACHGCVFIAETSCEQRNDLLDRSLIMDTLECAGAGFFGAVGGAAS
jgi:hypothetical protein